MKIALFSDIHANLPALNAFFKSVDRQDIDAIYCLGDLVGYNIWPNEIIEAIKKRNIPTIAGNHDYYISRMSTENLESYKSDISINKGGLSKGLTNELLTKVNRAYLLTLPMKISLEFELKDSNLNILLVHGSPNRIDEYLFEEKEDDSMLNIMNDANTDILCFGHTHKPFHKILKTDKTNNAPYKHAINIGSVGKPKDHNTEGCYVSLTINENASVFDKNSIQVEFIRFKYDIEKAAAAIENSILPNDFAENLRNGY
ncbi:YfcE family phosphodiesterase [Kriegella sp. EG-1]|nr:YfcE family phosphodiesterase [Flavobacteriaceae bacterium EG-1]